MRKPLLAAFAALAATYLVSPVHGEQSQRTAPSTTTTSTAPASTEKAPATAHDDCAKKGRTASHRCPHGPAVKGSEHKQMGDHARATQSPGSSEPAAKPTPAAPAKSSANVTYVCPMHPEVTSDKKGRCPKCGMFLELKK